MSRPLNFLHLTIFYPPYSFGGDAMYLYRLCHALGNAGHHVDVIHDIDSYHLLHPGEPEVQFAPHPNVKVYGIRTGFGSLSPLLSQQTGRPLLKNKYIRAVANSRPYDVVHFHNISLFGPGVMTLEPEQGEAIKVYTTHEHWLICPTHVLWKFNRKPCDRPECIRCTVGAKRPPQLWRYSKLLAQCSQQVDRFVSPSRFTAAMHARRGFPRPVGHLPYFLERVDDDWRKSTPRPHEKPYFLFVGRLELIKGLHTLIDVWRQVPDFDLLVVGTGTFEEHLRAMASANPRIRFLGPLPQRDLGTLYRHALASIVPSITYETFGIIIIESFARKTPVIVRDLGALPEVVHESNGGFVYGSDEDLLAHIRQIGTSPQLRTDLGENGYRAFVRYWSKEAHLKLYFNTLRSAAEEKFGYVPWESEGVSHRHQTNPAA